ncbi:MAG: hypothetical protein AAFX79_06005 [Planctomycetota bacterium]
MLDSLATGTQVTCTITSEPRSDAKAKTISRLMKLDSSIQRGLRRAQRRRRQSMRVYTRGGRDWYAREKASKGGIVRQGETFTLTYVPHLAPDLRSVEPYLSIESKA